jgi:hypothetical protein
MKNLALWLGALLISAGCLQAQVTVEVTLDQDQFLPGEALPATVRITNRSGQTLDLGADEGWLTFSVEAKEGAVAIKKGEAPVIGEFTLDSSKRAIKEVDLAPYFGFSQAGRYSITATVTIKAWNQQISSQPKSFDIIEGSKLWEQEVGLPKAPDAPDSAPELRRYTLHQANYLKKHLMLYVQITDTSGKVYKVFPIGPMISFGQPDAQVDRLSNLHILYQNGPHSFSYTVVSPEGSVVVRQSFDYTTRPRLKADSEGNFKVIGGTRRPMANDVPPPKIAEEKVQPPEP